MKKNFFKKHVLGSKKFLLLFVTICFLAVSCEDNYLPYDEKSIEVEGSKDYYFPELFDWENDDLMPWGNPSKPIYAPWEGAGSLWGIVSEDVLADRRAADGWELLYSTFKSTTTDDNPYFMLYNKYRGLLRVYLYLNDIGGFQNSTYLQDGLYIGGNSRTYKLLSFDSKEIVDPTESPIRTDRVQPKPYNNFPLVEDQWYFLQYEISYDYVPGSYTNPPQFGFFLNSTNITQVNLGGSLQGTLEGTIGSPSSSGENFWDVLSGEPLKTVGKIGLSAIGFNFLDSKSTDDEGGNTLGVNSTLWKKATDGLSGAFQSGVGGLPNMAMNVLSAVMGGSGSSETVTLNLDAELKITGTFENSGAVTHTISHYIPGSIYKDPEYYTYSNAITGMIPNYNKRLGVFNLKERPVVYKKYNNDLKLHTNIPDAVAEYSHQFYINTSEVYSLFKFNTSVINSSSSGATITDIKYELVADDAYEYWPWTEEDMNQGGDLFPLGNFSNGTKEYCSLGDVHTDENFIRLSTREWFSTFGIRGPKCDRDIYLRISFVVSPNNGAPKSRIVKTFKTDIQEL